VKWTYIEGGESCESSDEDGDDDSSSCDFSGGGPDDEPSCQIPGLTICVTEGRWVSTLVEETTCNE